MGKLLYFLSIFIYEVEKVAIAPSRISVIIYWSNQCSAVENSSSQVTSVRCPYSIWYCSVFHVLSPKSFLFVLFPFMSNRFSDYLKSITRNQSSEIVDIPIWHHASTACKLRQCHWFLHSGWLATQTFIFFNFLGAQKNTIVCFIWEIYDFLSVNLNKFAPNVPETTVQIIH